MVKSHCNYYCSTQARGVCDFSPPLGDVEAGRSPSDTGLPVVGSVQLDFGDTEITASAALTVDSTSIIYVGYTNSSGNFVGVVRISLYTKTFKIHEIVLVSKSVVPHHYYFTISTFPWPGKFFLHKNDVISCESAAVGEWTGLHICGYRIICKCSSIGFLQNVYANLIFV